MKYLSKLVDTNTEVDYFVNPTLQELDTIGSGVIRFIADNNSQQLYVWDAHTKTHSAGMQDLGMKYEDLWKPEKNMYYAGWAEKQGSKYIMSNSDTLEGFIEQIEEAPFRWGGSSSVVDKILNTDWSWIENYSIRNVVGCINSLKNKWKKIKSKLSKRAKFYDADKKTEYFVNPTEKELDSIPSRTVRFVADNNTKQVYCWDGWNVFHYNALILLKIPGPNIEALLPGYLLGTADKQGGKYVMTDSDRLDYHLSYGGLDTAKIKLFNEILNETDWSWVNQYINVTNCLNGIRKEFKTRIKEIGVHSAIAEKLVNLAEKLI